MSEDDIRALLEEKFSNKFVNFKKFPKFEFVRGVHNKIISIESSGGKGPSCDGRLLKHISGQGPIYIRANEEISISPDVCVTIKDESSSSEGNSTDDENTIITTSMYQPSPTSMTATNITTIDVMPYTSRANHNNSCSTMVAVPSAAESTQYSIQGCQRVISCPTCHEKFGGDEIEEHADICAESAWSGSEQQYVSLMSDLVNVDDVTDQQESSEPISLINENNEASPASDISPGNIKTELADVIRNLQANLGNTTNRLNVQRISVLDDYINKRVKCSWFSPQNKLKVVFMGESAIDDGGPRREFFSGNKDVY